MEEVNILIVELEHVTKNYKIPVRSNNFIKDLFCTKYKTVEAVKDVSLKIHDGETVGYIGLNGAGKSTTIKMMTGILTPSSGNVKMFGSPIQKNRIQKNKRFSVVFGQRSNLYYDLPVIDSFNFIELLYEVEPEKYKNNLDRICEILEIRELLNMPVRKLSLGQKMKCELAASLLFEPEILFLDEPTLGLDIFSKDNFLKCLNNINRELGTTIFLTSHNMEDIEKVCRRIIVLDRGKILFDGSINDIKNRVGDNHILKLFIEDYDSSKDIYLKYHNKLASDGIIELKIDKTKTNIADVTNYYFSNFNVKDINIENNSLEKLIKDLYMGTEKK